MEDRSNAPSRLVTALIIDDCDAYAMYDAIDSVLCQSYAHIELIVSSNDPSFDVDAAKKYIGEHAGPNVESVLVRCNDEVMPRARHLEIVWELSRGCFVLPIAASDRWLRSDAFDQFVHLLESLGSPVQVVASCAEQLGETAGSEPVIIPAEPIRRMLAYGDMQSLLDVECRGSALPASGSAYRREFFERVGSLSIYENDFEWPARVRWLLQGGRVHFLDCVTVQVRPPTSGAEPDDVVTRQRLDDGIRVFESDISPQAERLDKSVIASAGCARARRKALRINCDHRVSVLFVAKDEDFATSLDSSLALESSNFEITIGCLEQLQNQIIMQASDVYTTTPSLKRVKVIPMAEDMLADQKAAFARLECESTDGLCLGITSKYVFPHVDSLLSFVSKTLTGEALEDEGGKPVSFIPELKAEQAGAGRGAKFLQNPKAKFLLSNFSKAGKLVQGAMLLALAAVGLWIGASSEAVPFALKLCLYASAGFALVLLAARLSASAYLKIVSEGRK